MESLIVVPISKVAAQQRAGRAGRTAAGQCYRLYSRDCYANMVDETVPEILRTNLANTLLYLKVSVSHSLLNMSLLLSTIASTKLRLATAYCASNASQNRPAAALHYKPHRSHLHDLNWRANAGGVYCSPSFHLRWARTSLLSSFAAGAGRRGHPIIRLP